MTLAETRPGQIVQIRQIPDPIVRAQAIRFGICEGADVECFESIPKGPVILRRRRQEIAIGRRLAEKILVEPSTAKSSLRLRQAR